LASTDLEQTRLVLIAPARSTATLRPAMQLLLTDEGEHRAELFFSTIRGLRDLSHFDVRSFRLLKAYRIGTRVAF
jgi:hypothetical protein